MKNVGTLLALVAAVCVLVASPAVAQTTGGIAGKVEDQVGGAMQGATVTLSGPNMQRDQTMTTDPAGLFRFRNVPPGFYTLTVKATNFKDAKLENQQVFLGQEGTVKIVMTPAG